MPLPWNRWKVVRSRISVSRDMDENMEMLEKTVTKDGKVGGLMKHAGKSVIIIVTKKVTKN
jgi:hypothetical protein